jgi:hypothetical protein
MEAVLLESLLERGLTLSEIGARVGRHPSTVGYWIKKHGLVAAHHCRFAPKGAIERATLEGLVAAGLTLREIASRCDRSYTTVRYWVRTYGLGEAHEAGRRARAARRERMCARHGTLRFRRDGRGHYRCPSCSSEAVHRRRRRLKSMLVAELGGRCEICGYDRYLGALEFHHRDPTEKSFGVAGGGITRSLARLRDEVRKCALLCANCHAEVEGGVTALG